jgi:hypothetical protein
MCRALSLRSQYRSAELQLRDRRADVCRSVGTATSAKIVRTGDLACIAVVSEQLQDRPWARSILGVQRACLSDAKM